MIGNFDILNFMFNIIISFKKKIQNESILEIVSNDSSSVYRFQGVARKSQRPPPLLDLYIFYPLTSSSICFSLFDFYLLMSKSLKLGFSLCLFLTAFAPISYP